MLVVLYCYMGKFRACEPLEQYLLRTFSADMRSCTESGIVCGLCPYCAQTKCRRTVSVLRRLGLKTAHKFCRSARVRVRSEYTLISFHMAHHILFPHTFGVSSQSSHVMEERCRWNVCGIHIFKEKKGTAKICGTFMDAALVQQWSSGRKQPYLEVKYRRKIQHSGISSRWGKVILKFSSRKMAPESKRKYEISWRNSCLNQISHIAPIFSHWRYFFNFHRTDFIFLQDYQSQHPFLRFFYSAHKHTLDWKSSVQVRNHSLDVLNAPVQ